MGRERRERQETHRGYILLRRKPLGADEGGWSARSREPRGDGDGEEALYASRRALREAIEQTFVTPGSTADG